VNALFASSGSNRSLEDPNDATGYLQKDEPGTYVEKEDLRSTSPGVTCLFFLSSGEEAVRLVVWPPHVATS